MAGGTPPALACDAGTLPPPTSPAATEPTTATAELATVAMPGESGMRPRMGACASHESGPMASRRRPSETLRNARTTRGSNCAPAQRAISSRAATALPGSLYERADVITSNTSATATMRPASEMSSPWLPLG